MNENYNQNGGGNQPPYQNNNFYGQQPPQQPNPYGGQPPYTPYVDNSPMTVGNYITMLLLLCIPIANIVLLFVWAFGSTVNTNKKNFAKAYLILIGIIFAIYIVILILFSGVIFSALSSRY